MRILDRDHFNSTVGVGRSVGLFDNILDPAIVEFVHRPDLLSAPEFVRPW